MRASRATLVPLRQQTRSIVEPRAIGKLCAMSVPSNSLTKRRSIITPSRHNMERTPASVPPLSPDLMSSTVIFKTSTPKSSIHARIAPSFPGRELSRGETISLSIFAAITKWRLPPSPLQILSHQRNRIETSILVVYLAPTETARPTRTGRVLQHLHPIFKRQARGSTPKRISRSTCARSTTKLHTHATFRAVRGSGAEGFAGRLAFGSTRNIFISFRSLLYKCHEWILGLDFPFTNH